MRSRLSAGGYTIRAARTQSTLNSKPNNLNEPAHQLVSFADNRGDEFRLTGNKRTTILNLGAGSALDQIRVIVDDPDSTWSDESQ